MRFPSANIASAGADGPLVRNPVRSVAVPILCAVAAFSAGFGWVVPSPFSGARADTSETIEDLRRRLDAHLDAPAFAAASWGVHVISLESGEVWYDRNGSKLHKPASNAKLFTGAMALERLGPDYRFRTPVLALGAEGPDDDGRLSGDLVIAGRGDYSWSARFHDGDYAPILDPVVDAIAEAGVREITGDLIGDESYFRGSPFGTGWAADDLQYYYGAPVSALTVQDNVIDLRIVPGPGVGVPCGIATAPAVGWTTFVNRTITTAAEPAEPGWIRLFRPLTGNTVYVQGRLRVDEPGRSDSVTVSDPALWFLHLLEEALARRGVRTGGGFRTRTWLDAEVDSGAGADAGADARRIAEVQSPPLSLMVEKMMKPSQNLYAHLLWLHVGERSRGEGGDDAPNDAEEVPRGSEALGLREMKRFVRGLGIDESEVLLEEGSGLSRGGLVTPRAVTALLAAMRNRPSAEAFRNSLPVAGVDGTLRRRFPNRPVCGSVRAKTGTLRHVSALSGYLETVSGEPLAFSIMLNNFGRPGAEGRKAIDVIVEQLAAHGRGNESDVPCE